MRKTERTWRLAVVFLTIFAGSLSSYAQGRDSHEPVRYPNSELKVTSFPSGAHVSIDGTDTRELTPMRTDLRIGKHQVTVFASESGWNSETRTIEIVSGPNELNLTLLPLLAVGPQGPMGLPGAPGPVGPQGPSSGPRAHGCWTVAGTVGACRPARTSWTSGCTGTVGACRPARASWSEPKRYLRPRDTRSEQS